MSLTLAQVLPGGSVTLAAADSALSGPLMNWMGAFGMAAGILFIISGLLTGITRLNRGEGGFAHMLSFLVIGTMLFFMRQIMEATTWLIEGTLGSSEPAGNGKSEPSTPSPTPSESATPSPEPSTAPAEPPAESAPVPWEWIGAIAGLIITVVIAGLILWYFGSRGKAKLKEIQAAREALAARQKELDKQWADAVQLHDKLDEEWHSYESSLESILKNPLMRNLSDAAVSSSVRAMGKAKSLRRTKAPRLTADTPTNTEFDYLVAVSEYETRLRAAQQKAQLRGLDDFSDGDRGNIERARRLLAMALDPGATEHEQQSAYEQVIKLVKKVQKLSVPKEAFQHVELTAGVTSRGMLEAA